MEREFLSQETTGSKIFFKDTGNEVIFAIVPKYTIMAKIALAFSMIMPLMALDSLTESDQIQNILIITFILWFFIFIILFGLGILYRKDEEKETIELNYQNAYALIFRKSRTVIDNSCYFEIHRYEDRFENALSKVVLKSHQDTIQFQLHDLMVPIVNYLHARFSIRIKNEIDLAIPTFAMKPYSSKIIKIQEITDKQMKIGLQENPDKRSLFQHPAMNVGNFGLLVITLVIVYSIFIFVLQISSSILATSFILMCYMSFVMLKFISFGQKNLHITEIELNLPYTIRVGNIKADVNHKSIIQQTQITNSDTIIMDSRILAKDKVIMLPFYNNLEHTKKMNTELARLLNLEIEVIE